MDGRCVDSFSRMRGRLNRSFFGESEKADQCGAEEPEGSRHPNGVNRRESAATNPVKFYYKTKACREEGGFNKPRPVAAPEWF